MLENLTPFAAKILPAYDVNGRSQDIVIVKATLDFNANVVPHGRQLPIFQGDHFFDDASLKDVVRFESDQVAFKPLVDVIVNAFAYAPEGKPTAHFDAGVAVGRETRVVRVFGQRVWRNRLGIFPSVSAQDLALRVPVVYTLAYGGSAPDNDKVFAQENPTGTGFSAGLPEDGMQMPQVEWIDQLIRNSGDAPSPAGFGCYGRTWLPRRNFFGSYQRDELNAPGIIGKMPKSFNPAAWNCAHPRMQFTTDQVKPGTPIQWRNLSESGSQSILLPHITLSIAWTSSAGRQTVSPAFDTVSIEPEHGHFALTWRHVLPADFQHRMDAVHVHL